MTAEALRKHLPNSAWDGRIGPLIVAGASVAALLAIIIFAV